MNMTEDVNLGLLCFDGLEELFASEMLAPRSNLIQNAVRRPVRDKHIKSRWNLVPIALRCSAARIHECPIQEFRRVASFQYPRSLQTRRVNNSGDISWHKGRVFVSEVFRNEEIGLEQMDEDMHRVFFCNTELGEFNSSEMRFRPALRA